MKKKIISLLSMLALVFTSFAWMITVSSAEDNGVSLTESAPVLIENTKAFILESGEAQFVIKADFEAKKFRLYSKTEDADTYTLVTESKTPVLRATEFDSSLKYAVSALNENGIETNLFEITDYASYSTDYNAANILLGKTFTQNDTSSVATPLSSYGYELLTDGIIDLSGGKTGRYSSGKATTSMKTANAIVELGDEYFLDEIVFYIYNKQIEIAGTNFKLEVYSGDNWVTIVEGLKNEYDAALTEGDVSLSDYIVTVGSGKDSKRIKLDLGGIRASKIRFYSEAFYVRKDNGAYNNYVTFYETECSGVLVEDAFEKENVILNKPFVKEAAAPSYATFTNLADSGSNYSYAMMTDGKFGTGAGAGRYSSKKSGATYATVDLGGVYSLFEMRFYYFNKDFAQYGGTNYNVEVYYNGQWHTVIDQLSCDVISEGSINTSKHYVFLDLGGVRAEKIRLFIEARSSTAYVSLNEVECSGYCINTYEGESENVFLGKEFAGTEPTISSATIGGVAYTFGYDKLTDGRNYAAGTASTAHDGRFSSKKGGAAGGTIDLGNTYALDELRIYPFEKKMTAAGTDFTLEVYSEGVWRTLADNLSNEELTAHFVSKAYVSLDLGGIKAEKVRFYANSLVEGEDIYFVTLYEIECFGKKIDNKTISKAYENVFDEATASTSNGKNASNVNDGKLGTFVSGNSTNGAYSIELSFDLQNLYTLNIHEIIDDTNLVNGKIATASNDTKIEVYIDGTWLTLYDGVTLNTSGYTSLYLGGAQCEKMRISFTNTRNFDGEDIPRCAKISEITCIAGNPTSTDRAAMIEAYEKLTSLSINNEKFSEKMLVFRSYLTDFELNSKKAEAYAEEMNAYYETTKQDIISGLSFTPKMSITLESQLTMNVYVPTEGVQEFIFDGAFYKDCENTVTVDGKDYYHLTVSLPSAEAARDVKLIAKINANGVSATATFTFSIPKYAAKVLANSEASSVETTLVKDVLQYIKAAYTYFETNDDEAIAKIDSILGEYSSLPSFEGEYSSCYVGLKAVSFVLDGKPTMRFYLIDGADADDYKFYVDGHTASFKVSDDGTYVDIDVYAFALCETVSYTVNGEHGGSYHIRSYYDYVSGDGYTGDDKAELTALTSAFWKYLESARDYKNSVIVEVNYVDEGGNKLAASKKARISESEEIKLVSPAVDGYYTRDIYLNVSSAKGKSIDVVYKAIPKNIDTAYVNEILSNIVAWGDSITAGAGGSTVDVATQYGIDLEALGSTANGGNYVTVLTKLLKSYVYTNLEVAGCGIGGETTASIAARADTETYYLYLDGAVTVADATVSVPLTHYASCGRVGILRQGGSAHVNSVTIVGKDTNGNDISVSGTLAVALTNDAPSGTDIRTCDAKYLNYTFTRNDGKTNEISFVSGARVITKSSYLYDGRTCIIFMGENGGYSDIQELIKQQEEILAACGNPEYYLIISSTSGSYESRTEIREALSARWGKNYINMGDKINSREAYEFAGYSESVISTVESNIALGKVSTLLIKDSCHPNAVGYAVIGNLIFERLIEIGVFDAIFDYYDSLNGLN